MDRSAVTAVPLHPLLAGRWSPRAFDGSRALTRADLLPLLEAARWAPSSGNTQPTRWLVTLRGEPAYERLYDTLSRGNRSWAGRAPALLLAVSLQSDDSGRPYPSAAHDTGQAVAHLSVQAAAQGLAVHQMAGFDAAAVRSAFGLTDVQQPAVVVAVGVPGGPPLEGRLAEKEAAPRVRKPLEELLLPAGPGDDHAAGTAA